MAAVAVAVSISVSVPIGVAVAVSVVAAHEARESVWMPVAVAIPMAIAVAVRRAESGRQQDDGGRQVVLDRIEEEEAARGESDEGEDQTNGLAGADRALAADVGGTPEERQERQGRYQRGEDEQDAKRDLERDFTRRRRPQPLPDRGPAGSLDLDRRRRGSKRHRSGPGVGQPAGTAPAITTNSQPVCPAEAVPLFAGTGFTKPFVVNREFEIKEGDAIRSAARRARIARSSPAGCPCAAQARQRAAPADAGARDDCVGLNVAETLRGLVE